MNDKHNQLSTELRTVVTRLVKKLRRESVTGQQLSLTERSTMALLLQHGSQHPSELAAMEKITNQSMSQILNHLLGSGWIVRTISETDKRKAMISLTSEGEMMIIQVRSERDEWLAKAIRATCSAEEQAILAKALVPLSKIVDFK